MLQFMVGLKTQVLLFGNLFFPHYYINSLVMQRSTRVCIKSNPCLPTTEPKQEVLGYRDAPDLFTPS